ncbi:MAG: hypothetical protein ACK5NG_05975 [Chthoniobacterales bacterium]
MSQTSSTSGPKSTWSLIFYVVLAFIMILLFWMGAKWLASGSDLDASEEALRRTTRLETLDKIRKEEAAKADSYAWIDREKGKVQIPVERAMELTVAEMAAQGTKVQAAYPVGGMPGAAPAPTPEATPAPAETPAEATAEATPAPAETAPEAAPAETSQEASEQ